MLCNLSQLNQYQYKRSQTSSGITLNNVVLDRESGRDIVIQDPSFDLMIRTDSYLLSADKLILLLRCLLIIQALSEDAVKEASEELEGIYRFYVNRLPHSNVTMIPTSIRGTLSAIQVRPSLVLAP